jgi:hypothetical protein
MTDIPGRMVGVTGVSRRMLGIESVSDKVWSSTDSLEDLVRALGVPVWTTFFATGF